MKITRGRFTGQNPSKRYFISQELMREVRWLESVNNRMRKEKGEPLLKDFKHKAWSCLCCITRIEVGSPADQLQYPIKITTAKRKKSLLFEQDGVIVDYDTKTGKPKIR